VGGTAVGGTSVGVVTTAGLQAASAMMTIMNRLANNTIFLDISISPNSKFDLERIDHKVGGPAGMIFLLGFLHLLPFFVDE
jgi:hypothetical protein